MANIYKELLEMLQKGIPAVLETCTGNSSVASNYGKKLFPLKDMADSCPGRGLPSWKNGRLLEYFYPEERLIILGGGHVALALSDFGARAGFSVTVADDRPAFANKVRFESASEVLCDSFENVVNKLHITASDYVVVLTRGHRFDKECLGQILKGVLPAYLGMMGSKRRSAGMREILIEEGFNAESVDKIHMPIGIDIGALLPEEIAISILAQIIAGRRRNTFDNGCSQADVDFRVLRKLASDNAPHAVVTILSAKGPTPRRPGAKMAVWPEGRIEGSIGGGCAEAAIMREALKYIGTGKCCVRTVDMTKDVSEDDVMVCGGIMEVLIEG